MRAFVLLVSVLGMLGAKEPVLSLNGLHLYNARDVLKYDNLEDGRKIILILSSKRCSHCDVYKRLLASIEPRYKKQLNSKYIFAFAEDDTELNKIFNLRTTPTTIVLDSKRRLVVEPMAGDPQNISELVFYLLNI